MQRYSDIADCVDAIIEQVGKDICLGMPLGLGKPNHLVNALYQRVKHDSSLRLHIVSALSLEKPTGKSALERRFLEPFVARVFAGVPDMDFVVDLRNGKLPQNVEISEFFFKAGSYLNTPSQQRNYISSNYTHIARDFLAVGVNLMAQSVSVRAESPGLVSLSANPDTSLDLIPQIKAMQAAGGRILMVGEVNRELPYMINHAEVAEDSFDLLLDNPQYSHPLFGVPNTPIAPADHMIGFLASSLLRDGGTLQVGIGSLGSALTYSACLRHQDNATYRALAEALDLQQRFPASARDGGLEPFAQGLYGCSEMLVDGFLHLYRAGILKREVFDDAALQELLNAGELELEVNRKMLDTLQRQQLIGSALRETEVEWLKRFGIFQAGVEWRDGQLWVDGQQIAPQLDEPPARAAIEAHCLGERLQGGIIAHGGFFVGPTDFYQKLRALTPQEQQQFCMSSVLFINHLYDHRFGRQRLKQAQRRDARFINSAMMYSLSGAATSDGLENGKVVSGVGGQYNFVSMAHELPDARSILCLRSTRSSAQGTLSNIVFSYGHCTIPRHLRDIVITEYGIADLRGKSDQAVYTALIEIADARFQQELLAQAVKADKVSAAYRLPAACRNNTPEHLHGLLKPFLNAGHFPAFPFGTDFTPEELRLGQALKSLEAATATRWGLLRTLWRCWRQELDPSPHQALLARMGLQQASGWRERLERKMLLLALQSR